MVYGQFYATDVQDQVHVHDPHSQFLTHSSSIDSLAADLGFLGQDGRHQIVCHLILLRLN